MYVNMRSIYGPVVQISKKQYDAFLKGYKKAIAENHEQEPPERYNDKFSVRKPRPDEIVRG